MSKPQRPRWLLIALCVVVAFALWGAADSSVWYIDHGGMSGVHLIYVIFGLALPVFLALLCYALVRWAALLAIIVASAGLLVDVMWLMFGKGTFFGADMTPATVVKAMAEAAAWLVLGIGALRSATAGPKAEAD